MQPSSKCSSLVLVIVASALAFESALAVITVNIGGATRLNSLSRQRERYNCYWDCDLVGCQIARDDDECAYDCEKICRVRYDYAATGRSGSELGAKSALAADAKPAADESQLVSGKYGHASSGLTLDTATHATPSSRPPTATGRNRHTAGSSVRLHLPRNASARNFGFWERCGAQDGLLEPSAGEKPASL